MNIDLQKNLSQTASLVNQRMAELLPKENNFEESKLNQAMRYSALSIGKRIRAFLIIQSANIFNSRSDALLDVASAIEFIHVYSLIHDDLPAMDDDDFRRGELSCHKKFDEATAILAGDSLLTYAFEILSSPRIKLDPKIKCQLINEIAKAIGFNGMAGGQMIDLESANKKLNYEQIIKLHKLKTAELFMTSAAAGAIIGNANQEEKQALINYAHDIGLAFQIKDDILDCKKDQENQTNSKSKNKKPGSISIVEVIGMDGAKKQLTTLEKQAISHLVIFDNRASILKELAKFIVNQQN